MVRCVHCKEQHASVSDVRDCFHGAHRQAESSGDVETSTPEICWRCHQKHGSSLGEIWNCRERVAPKTDQNDPVESELKSSDLRGVSCGEPHHRHPTVPEARECYLLRSGQKQVSKATQKTQLQSSTKSRNLHKIEFPILTPNPSIGKRAVRKVLDDSASDADDSHKGEIRRSTKCKHGVRRDRCFDCRKPPKGVNAVVYITKGGLAFHNSRDCKVLRMGQKSAESSGMNTHEVTSVAWSQVALERDACLYCCN
jgi:hypothetical protein